jgi:hypothetical protein
MLHADLIIIPLNINLFSPWYSWTIAELALNNNHISRIIKFVLDLPVRVMVFNATSKNICYILVVSFIGGGNRSIRRKPLNYRKSLINFILINYFMVLK